MDNQSTDRLRVSGKVIEVTRVIEGVGRNNVPWRKQQLIIEQMEEGYVKLAAVAIWNDHIGTVNPGQYVTALISIEANLYNGNNPKYFGTYVNNISCWKLHIRDKHSTNNQQS